MMVQLKEDDGDARDKSHASLLSDSTCSIHTEEAKWIQQKGMFLITPMVTMHSVQMVEVVLRTVFREIGLVR